MYLAIFPRALSQALIVAGYDKVYTIGRYFRNEGIDRSHHPEFPWSNDGGVRRITNTTWT